MVLVVAILLAQPQTLPEVQQRLNDERAAAQKLAGRESTLLGRLADLERQIEVEGRALRAAQVRMKRAAARMEESEERARAAEAEVEKAVALLEPRLVARYKLGR